MGHVEPPAMTNSRARKLILLVSAVALLAPLTPVPSVNAQGITGPAKCKNGMAGQFPCHKIDLVGYVSAEDMGGAGVADVWGWIDPETKKEYAILGTTNGVQFIDVTDPAEPIYLGRLPLKAPGGVLIWQEIEILNDTAYIVCDLDPCGLQIFDLNRLRGAESALPVWRPDVVMPFGTAHSIDSNPETNHLFLNGPAVAVGTPVILDVSQPLAPVPVGVIADDGYTHDSLCRNYKGPDKDHKGHEICFNFNEDSVTIYDVTANPQQPVLLSRNTYESASYTHSGALSKDHSTLISTDEGDETGLGFPSTLYIWDVRSLAKPKLIAMWHAKSESIDHNVYSEADALFHANYVNGFRILDLKNAHKGKLKEVAWFDTVPTDDSPSFNGAWAAYPFLPSGNILVGHMDGGLFIVRPEAGVLESLGVTGKRATMSSL
jgi:choice-of-anchor B domain-containing protein